tara:strand:+ start:423 stop:953 length:531 start_codon:yes stop_codon:yes gene_type:complete
MATKFLKDLPKDLNKKISRDFNNLIKDVHFELSNRNQTEPTTMPVFTGFFASSWKAQNSPVIPNHKVENYEPWATQRRIVWKAFSKGQKIRPPRPVVKPRFPVGSGKRIFNYRKAVWIGNKAEYSKYVLESGEIQRFVQGQLGRLIKENMSDKGKIFIESEVSEKYSGISSTFFEA